MIKLVSKNILVAATLATIGAAAQAQTPGVDMTGTVGYVIDQRGYVAKSGFGLCWRTGYWTPAMAIAECDPELAKKKDDGSMDKKPAAGGPKPAAKKVTLAADALFDFNKSTLRPEGKSSLDKLVMDIKNIKLEVIIAVGHADRVGKDAYNQKLSERRAASVKDYLVSKGVEANRVYAEGKGEKQPVTAGKCGKSEKKTKQLIDCLQPDRRVEIEVIGTQN
jgi:OOP family OmpA-OmpF porin